MPTMPPRIGERRQRVCVLVDNGSLYTALYELGIQCRIDYRRLRKWLIEGRVPKIVRFYCGEIRGDQSSKKPFYNFLKRVGFDIISIHEPKSRAEHAALDEDLCAKIEALMSIDMVSFVGKCDKIVLVSGSSRLVNAVRQVQDQGIDVEVNFFEEAVSDDLLNEANGFRGFQIEEVRMQELEKV
jgi:uncharacterized LabA/DUF88 family protein